MSKVPHVRTHFHPETLDKGCDHFLGSRICGNTSTLSSLNANPSSKAPSVKYLTPENKALDCLGSSPVH
eukprot:3594598-Pyramimonas_sp.AAC.1